MGINSGREGTFTRFGVCGNGQIQFKEKIDGEVHVVTLELKSGDNQDFFIAIDMLMSSRQIDAVIENLQHVRNKIIIAETSKS